MSTNDFDFQAEAEDYTEADRYDWDINDPSQYCRHGKFIGSSAGPDILCGYCEDGTTDEEYREIVIAMRRDRFVTALLSEFMKPIMNVHRTFRRITDTEGMAESYIEEIKRIALEMAKEGMADGDSV